MLRSPEEDNVITSFEARVRMVQGALVGMCLKFARWDRTSQVTHWSLAQYRHLLKALRLYLQTLGASAFMVRAHTDPSLVAALPARHPYRSLLQERPTLTDGEAAGLQASTQIVEVGISLRAHMLEMRLTFADGRKEKVFLHEYLALSLLGYLDEHVNAPESPHGPVADDM